MNPSRSSIKKAVGGVIVALALLYGLSSILEAAPPLWWAEREVINTNAPSDDYAAVTLGQLRHIAQQAYEEMATHYPRGAGPEKLRGRQIMKHVEETCRRAWVLDRRGWNVIDPTLLR